MRALPCIIKRRGACFIRQFFRIYYTDLSWEVSLVAARPIVCPLLRGGTARLKHAAALLPPFAGRCREEITFATLSAQRNEQELILSLSCFETFPNPEDRFLIEFGEAEGGLSLPFSCSQAELPEGVVLTRDGGENLEGIFWGARVSVPLLLLGPLEGLPISVRYQRGGVVSSPFPNGVGVIFPGEAPCSC